MTIQSIIYTKTLLKVVRRYFDIDDRHKTRLPQANGYIIIFVLRPWSLNIHNVSTQRIVMTNTLYNLKTVGSF